MSQHSYTITVKGHIKVKDGYHYAQGWAAGGIASLATDDDPCYEHIESKAFVYNDISHCIEGDLILDRNVRLTPYACYSAEGGVAVCSGPFGMMGDVNACSGFYPAVHYYRVNMGDIKRLLEVKTDERVVDVLYRGMYIQAFSVLELFLCDYLLCGIFNIDGCYEKAIKHYKLDSIINQEEIETRIIEKVNKQVYHRFNDVRDLYEGILDKKLPDTGQLSRMRNVRHDLVHRYVFTTKNHMDIISVTKSDLCKLIAECDKFVSRLGV